MEHSTVQRRIFSFAEETRPLVRVCCNRKRSLGIDGNHIWLPSPSKINGRQSHLAYDLSRDEEIFLAVLLSTFSNRPGEMGLRVHCYLSSFVDSVTIYVQHADGQA